MSYTSKHSPSSEGIRHLIDKAINNGTMTSLWMEMFMESMGIAPETIEWCRADREKSWYADWNRLEELEPGKRAEILRLHKLGFEKSFLKADDPRLKDIHVKL